MFNQAKTIGPTGHEHCVKQWFLVLSLLLCFCSPVLAFDPQAHLWQHRLLLVGAVSKDDPAAKTAQENLAKRSDALIDRDLVVLQLYETGGGFIDEKPIAGEESLRIRALYGIVPGDSVLVLVGKDGGIKSRSSLEADLGSVFEQIDAMPMRREEMRRKEASNQPVTPAYE